MTDEKKAKIEALAEILFKARQKRDGLGMRNIYGMAADEALRSEKEFQLADAEYIEATVNMEAAKKQHTDIREGK